MARATIRIDYDGGGHIEIAEQAHAGMAVPDLTTQAVLLAQGAFEKLIRAAGMTLQPAPPVDELGDGEVPAGAVDTVRQNGKANDQAAARAAGKRE
jgi:hypothetical protein